MHDTGVARWSGISAVVGGIAWVAACLVQAAQPRGCVGDECDTLPMRDTPALGSLLLSLAVLALLASGAGLLTLIRRRRGDLPRAGLLGAGLCLVGVTVLGIAAAVQALFYDGDFPLMPGFVVPGVLCLSVGLVLLAWTVIGSRVLPTWAGASLLVGALLLLATNEQTSAVLFAIPFGVAWVATGVALTRSGALAATTSGRSSAVAEAVHEPSEEPTADG